MNCYEGREEETRRGEVDGKRGRQQESKREERRTEREEESREKRIIRNCFLSQPEYTCDATTIATWAMPTTPTNLWTRVRIPIAVSHPPIHPKERKGKEGRSTEVREKKRRRNHMESEEKEKRGRTAREEQRKRERETFFIHFHPQLIHFHRFNLRFPYTHPYSWFIHSSTSMQSHPLPSTLFDFHPISLLLLS